MEWCFPPPHHAGTAALAELIACEVDQLYAAERYCGRPAERPDLASLAVSRERSERGDP